MVGRVICANEMYVLMRFIAIKCDWSAECHQCDIVTAHENPFVLSIVKSRDILGQSFSEHLAMKKETVCQKSGIFIF